MSLRDGLGNLDSRGRLSLRSYPTYNHPQSRTRRGAGGSDGSAAGAMRGEYRARRRKGCARPRTQIDRGPRKADALWGEDCHSTPRRRFATCIGEGFRGERRITGRRGRRPLQRCRRLRQNVGEGLCALPKTAGGETPPLQRCSIIECRGGVPSPTSKKAPRQGEPFSQPYLISSKSSAPCLQMGQTMSGGKVSPSYTQPQMRQT